MWYLYAIIWCFIIMVVMMWRDLKAEKSTETIHFALLGAVILSVFWPIGLPYMFVIFFT